MERMRKVLEPRRFGWFQWECGVEIDGIIYYFVRFRKRDAQSAALRYLIAEKGKS